MDVYFSFVQYSVTQVLVAAPYSLSLQTHSVSACMLLPSICTTASLYLDLTIAPFQHACHLDPQFHSWWTTPFNCRLPTLYDMNTLCRPGPQSSTRAPNEKVRFDARTPPSKYHHGQNPKQTPVAPTNSKHRSSKFLSMVHVSGTKQWLVL